MTPDRETLYNSIARAGLVCSLLLQSGTLACNSKEVPPVVSTKTLAPSGARSSEMSILDAIEMRKVLLESVKRPENDASEYFVEDLHRELIRVAAGEPIYHPKMVNPGARGADIYSQSNIDYGAILRNISQNILNHPEWIDEERAAALSQAYIGLYTGDLRRPRNFDPEVESAVSYRVRAFQTRSVSIALPYEIKKLQNYLDLIPTPKGLRRWSSAS